MLGGMGEFVASACSNSSRLRTMVKGQVNAESEGEEEVRSEHRV
jgi:hypothetical protein